MFAIEIKNLTFTYSKKTPFEKKALDCINLSVDEGSFVGIIGETGSGKSTLIQHLNGLIKQQNKKEGSISVLGMDARDKKTLKKLRFSVGMVFQYPEYQLFEDSVAKDIAFGPKNMKLAKNEINNRVRHAMEVVGLPYDEFVDRSPFDLSGGEKRRAAIAGVIAMQPKILVLDEPVAGLDPVGRSEILMLIKKLQAEISPTIILVSHNMDDIAVLADRIIALKDGRIVSDGTPKEVFSARETIREIGLDIPSATKLSDKLIARGINLPTDIVTMEQLRVELVKLKNKGDLTAKNGDKKCEKVPENSENKRVLAPKNDENEHEIAAKNDEKECVLMAKNSESVGGKADV